MNGEEEKKIVISKEEARIIVSLLKSVWVPMEQQKAAYELIWRIEREIDN